MCDTSSYSFTPLMSNLTPTSYYFRPAASGLMLYIQYPSPSSRKSTCRTAFCRCVIVVIGLPCFLLAVTSSGLDVRIKPSFQSEKKQKSFCFAELLFERIFLLGRAPDPLATYLCLQQAKARLRAGGPPKGPQGGLGSGLLA